MSFTPVIGYLHLSIICWRHFCYFFRHFNIRFGMTIQIDRELKHAVWFHHEAKSVLLLLLKTTDTSHQITKGWKPRFVIILLGVCIHISPRNAINMEGPVENLISLSLKSWYVKHTKTSETGYLFKYFYLNWLPLKWSYPNGMLYFLVSVLLADYHTCWNTRNLRFRGNDSFRNLTHWYFDRNTSDNMVYTSPIYKLWNRHDPEVSTLS